MASRSPFNSVAGFSVGEIPANVVLANGDIITGNLQANANITANGNITANFFIGNGSQLTGVANIRNGNSNVQVYANANIAVSSAGNANILVVTGTGANITGTLSATGNANVNNIGTGIITATGNITGSNLITAGVVSATGNITGNYFIGNGSQLTGITANAGSSINNENSNVSVSTPNGSIVVTANAGTEYQWDFNTTGSLTVPGDIRGTGSNSYLNLGEPGDDYIALQSNPDVGLLLFSEDVSLLGNAYIDIIANTGANSLNWRFDSSGNLTLPANTFAVNYANGTQVQLGGGGSSISNGASNVSILTVGGDVTTYVDSILKLTVGNDGANIVGNLTVSGNTTIGNLVTSGSSGNISGANVISANTISASGNITAGNLTSTGLTNLGPVGNVTITGGTNGQVLTTDGSNVLSWTTVSGGGGGSNISNGNSNVNIATANSNVTITSNGTHTWNFDETGNLIIPGYINGLINASVVLNAFDNGDSPSATILNWDVANSTPNTLFSVDTTQVIIQANINNGNTQQWTFDNTGNLTLPANTFSINYANGTQVSLGGSSLPISNGNSNINIATANGNVTVTSNGTYTWDFDDTGNLTVPGNVNFDGGNIQQALNTDLYIKVQDQDDDGWFLYNTVTDGANSVTQTRVSRSEFTISTDIPGVGYNWSFDSFGRFNLPGNIQGVDYSNTSIYAYDNGATGSVELKTISFAGDTLGSNVRVTQSNATISTNNATHTWTFDNAGNLSAPGAISATGNITGANLTTGGDLSVTGNATVGNLVTGGSSGNISGANVITANLFTGTLTTGDQPNITSTGTLTSLSVSGNITGGNIIGPLANGNSNVNIATANGNVTITSNGTENWTFDTTGNLTLPGDMIITGNITPTSNLTYSLGNNTNRFNNLYLSGNTIVLGDQTISANTTNVIFSGVMSGNADGLTNIPAANITGNAGSNFTANYSNYSGNLVLVGDEDNVHIYTSNLYIQSYFQNGNAYSSQLQYENFWQAGATDDVTEVNSGYARIQTTLSDINDPLFSIELQPANTGIAQNWTFDGTGNLTLPANTFAVNYANGTQVSLGGGNTGNVTFSNQIVIGTGTEDGSSGLYLATGPNGAANLQYLRVRGGDFPTHIHLDTGNNAYYDQYFGNDNKYLKLGAGTTGNITIGTDDDIGNLYNWTFNSTGNLTVPGNIQTITTGFPFTNDITDITTGNATVIVTIQDNTFGGLDSGQVTISDVVGTIEANGTWYFEATDPDTFQLYNDEALTSPVDGTTWTAYVSGGLAVAQGYSNISITGGNVQVITNGGNTWNFDDTGNLTIPDSIIGPGSYSTLNLGTSSSNTASLTVLYSALSVTETLVELFASSNVKIYSNNSGAGKAWTFDDTGNLTLPDNTFAVNYANGTQVSLGSNANIGNVTFNDQIVIGTGLDDGTGGLYLATGPNGSANLQYLRVRGGDVATHIHLDTGNNSFYDQYFGNDSKYLKLNAGDTGNIVIGTDDGNGNLYSWTFDSTGNLNLPGNLVITGNTNVFGTDAALIQSNDNIPISLLSSGANGSIASIWVEDIGNVISSNIAAVYANPIPGSGIVRIIAGQNGGSGPNIWDFNTTGNLILPTISLGAGIDEQTYIRSQRKVIPPNRYSVEITGSTPTIVYTASTGTQTIKTTLVVQHISLGFEMFDVSALGAGANVLYSVSNRLNSTGQPDTTAVVDWSSGVLAITLTVNSGATTSYVTYDSTEFGIAND